MTICYPIHHGETAILPMTTPIFQQLSENDISGMLNIFLSASSVVAVFTFVAAALCLLLSVRLNVSSKHGYLYNLSKRSTVKYPRLKLPKLSMNMV